MKKCKILEFLCFSTQKREEPDCYVYPAGLLRKKKKIHAGFLRNPLPSPWASSANQNKKISLESKLSDEILFLVCDPCRIALEMNAGAPLCATLRRVFQLFNVQKACRTRKKQQRNAIMSGFRRDCAASY